MIRKLILRSILFLCSWLVIIPANAHFDTIELLGVKLPDKIVLQDSKESVILNGYAVNTMWGEEIYVAALYTPKIEKKAQMLLLNDQPMAMMFYFVQDDLTPEMLIQAITESIMVNNYENRTKQFDQTRLLELQNQWLMTINAGDILSFQYTPQNGTVSMLLNGQLQYQWTHAKTFFNMLLKTWIGPHPPTREFKRAILDFPVGTYY